MTDALEPWPSVLTRLGLTCVGTCEDGLVYAHTSSTCRLEVHVKTFRDPATVRIVVRPEPAGVRFLLAPIRVVPVTPQWRTGDVDFDAAVAIVSGGRQVLHRLSRGVRRRLMHLVGTLGATVGGTESTLEPAMTARLTTDEEAMDAIAALTEVTVALAQGASVEDLIDRWLQEDGAPGVEVAVSRRVLELLPDLTETQAELACRHLTDRTEDPPVSLIVTMPPYPVVLRTWFRVGDPLDPRIGDRVVQAWQRGSARPAARYVGWLMVRMDELPEGVRVVQALWNTPGLIEDPEFARELVRSVRRTPPEAGRPLVQQLVPRSSAVARRLGRVLAGYAHPEADARLVQWLRLPGSGVRRAAGEALANRVKEELEAARAERVAHIAEASRTSGALIGALVTLDKRHTWWLARLRPHGEPDAIVLIRRLGEGGANVDDTLLYWLDRGTRAVRLAAVEALAAVGTPKVVPALRERATGWFGDSTVRDRCRRAAMAIRERAGGAGNLALAASMGGGLAEATSAGGLSEDS